MPSSSCKLRVLWVSCVVLALIIVSFTLFLLWPEQEYDILVISDIRLDRRYDPTGDVESMCRNKSKSAAVSREFGRYGCDTPMPLYKAMLDAALSSSSNPIAVIVNGGILSAPESLEEIKNEASSLVHTIQEYYGSVPVLLSLGNTEFLPSYGSVETDKAAFNNLASIVEKGTYAKNVTTFWQGGFYSYDLQKAKLKVLVVNSMPYVQHRYSADLGEDPYGQFGWLESQMKAAEAQKLKVGIVYSTPFKIESEDQWNDQFSLKFADLIQSPLLSFITSSSTFYDELLPLHNSTLFSLSTPSVSPRRSSNPGFRVMKIKSGGLRDVVQYSGDISGVLPTWKKEYSFSEEYHLDSIDLATVIQSILSNRDNFMSYMNKRTVQSRPEYSTFRCMLASTNKTGVAACIDQSL